ncbi:uncharacterized protein EV420DRAFT_1480261 [Desarmillaria tabescens]|uniref:Heterokaryon incompatibility domain-containing protein n=1 Tax=Armillaria tabescens TaxID=1929756 RepID=A0AA39KDY3_ARMTA|nr:uncharacterized protein EV420DRAFT_1480261 [Desarmillaria tabescens]KAK0458111.1 hypothetical protein EV420DRAFT_1480261 [Desarmillaria tabescens]
MMEPWRPPREISLPEVTISAFAETGQVESSIIVPLQRTYIGRKPVISSRLADTPCATLGIQGLLDQLNATLGTSHTLDTPFLSSLLKDCITNNYDFGMAYGRLRRIWYTRNWGTIRGTLRKWEKEDREINRVVPSWNMGISVNDPPHKWIRPISHAWVDEKNRVNVQTPINGYEWPVPIPKDANLKLIRIEMLNLGVEYTWLDVLCLRQKGGQREVMRIEEWKLDVPTIGAVYQCSAKYSVVVCYLSGLGQPLSLKEGDLDSDRCWFRRAWTLQEVGFRREIAGDTLDGPMHPKYKDGKYETALLTRFHKQLQSMDSILQGTFVALESMQNRVSTNPLDKVAGLAFIMWSHTIPAYDESQSLEEAWTALVNSMNVRLRGQLFFLYPEPGNAGTKWRPSWDQVMTKPLLANAGPSIYIGLDPDIDPGPQVELDP